MAVTIAKGKVTKYVCPDIRCFKILNNSEYEDHRNRLCPKCKSTLVSSFKRVIDWSK